MRKKQPKQRPNQKAPQHQRRVARKLKEGRAAREEVRVRKRAAAAAKLLAAKESVQPTS